MEEEIKTSGKRKSNDSINYLSLHEKCRAYLDFEDGETCDSIVKNINRIPKLSKTFLRKQ